MVDVVVATEVGGAPLEVVVERIGAGWYTTGVRGCMDTLGGEFVPTVDP